VCVCVCVFVHACVCNLINVVEFEVFEEQQQQSRDGLDDDFLVTVHVNSQLHALKDCDTGTHTHTQTHTHTHTHTKAFRSLMIIQLCLSKRLT